MDINVTINVWPKPGPSKHLIFTEKSRYPISAPPELVQALKLKGLKVNYVLNDDTAIDFTISATDEFGNPTTVGLGTPTVTVADTTIATAAVDATGVGFTVTPVGGKLGTTTVTVTVPVGSATLTGVINLTVQSGTATQLVFTPGTTTPIAPPAPAPTS